MTATLSYLYFGTITNSGSETDTENSSTYKAGIQANYSYSLSSFASSGQATSSTSSTQTSTSSASGTVLLSSSLSDAYGGLGTFGFLTNKAGGGSGGSEVQTYSFSDLATQVETSTASTSYILTASGSYANGSYSLPSVVYNETGNSTTVDVGSALDTQQGTVTATSNLSGAAPRPPATRAARPAGPWAATSTAAPAIRSATPARTTASSRR